MGSYRVLVLFKSPIIYAYCAPVVQIVNNPENQSDELAARNIPRYYTISGRPLVRIPIIATVCAAQQQRGTTTTTEGATVIVRFECVDVWSYSPREPVSEPVGLAAVDDATTRKRLCRAEIVPLGGGITFETHRSRNTLLTHRGPLVPRLYVRTRAAGFTVYEKKKRKPV